MAHPLCSHTCIFSFVPSAPTSGLQDLNQKCTAHPPAECYKTSKQTPVTESWLALIHRSTDRVLVGTDPLAWVQCARSPLVCLPDAPQGACTQRGATPKSIPNTRSQRVCCMHAPTQTSALNFSRKQTTQLLLNWDHTNPQVKKPPQPHRNPSYAKRVGSFAPPRQP